MDEPKVVASSNLGLKLVNAFGVMSEQQLQPKLNVARVAGGGDSAEGWGAEEVVRQIKVWVVEEVEGFGAELKFHAFRKICVLYKRCVHALEAWSLKNVSPGVAECSRSRECERGGVEPL
jgi:hypothetical protein